MPDQQPTRCQPPNAPCRMPPHTGAGEFKSEPCVVSFQTRLKVVVRVPAEVATVGGDLPSDFEPHLRKAIAEALVGVDAEGFTVVYAAVEQFEDAGG
jgi:hypothetical protein